MSEWSYVDLAYGLTWAVLLSYGGYLGRRLRRAREAMAEAELEAAAQTGARTGERSLAEVGS